MLKKIHIPKEVWDQLSERCQKELSDKAFATTLIYYINNEQHNKLREKLQISISDGYPSSDYICKHLSQRGSVAKISQRGLMITTELDSEQYALKYKYELEEKARELSDLKESIQKIKGVLND